MNNQDLRHMYSQSSKVAYIGSPRAVLDNPNIDAKVQFVLLFAEIERLQTINAQFYTEISIP